MTNTTILNDNAVHITFADGREILAIAKPDDVWIEKYEADTDLSHLWADEPTKYRITYSTPLSRSATQIVNAHTAVEAIGKVLAFDVPVRIKSVSVQDGDKWIPIKTPTRSRLK